jgi:hypothetical protein
MDYNTSTTPAGKKKEECPFCKKLYINVKLHTYKMHKMAWVICCEKYVDVDKVIHTNPQESKKGIEYKSLMCEECWT